MSCPGSWGRGRGWPRSCVCLYRLCVAPGGPVVGSVVGSGVIPPQYIPVSTNHVCEDALSRWCFILRLPGDVYLRGHHSTLMGWAAGCGRLPHGPGPPQPSTLNPQPGSWVVSRGDSWRLGAARPSAWGARPPLQAWVLLSSCLACLVPELPQTPTVRCSRQQELPSGPPLRGTAEAAPDGVSGACGTGSCGLDGASGAVGELWGLWLWGPRGPRGLWTEEGPR